MFGTGKFFETGDQANVDMQSFYGVRDECALATGSGCTSGVSNAKVTQSELLQQTVTASTNASFTTRTVSKNTDATKKGYYLNLGLSTDPDNKGERVISDMMLLDERVVFTSTVPNDDVCAFGGSTWLWQLNALTGGAADYAVFDFNKDGTFDPTADRGSAVKTSGIMRRPSLLTPSGSNTASILGNSGGAGAPTTTLPKTQRYGDFGRQTWRKVR